MKHLNLVLLTLLVTFLSILRAESVMGRCVGITDGDTATVLLLGNRQEKIRFWGIDAPESSQDFGQVARKKLSELIFNKEVRVDITGRDKYGRSIGKVYVGPLYTNLEMVRCGLAWHYVQYAPDDMDLADAEKDARVKKIGLWQHSSPTAPWQWRRGGSAAAANKQSLLSSAQSGRYWVSGNGKIHNKTCRYYGSSSKGRYMDEASGVNCKLCGGAGSNEATAVSSDNNADGTKYWVTSTGKTHSPGCRYYGTTKRGYYTTKPTGNNCKKCGGAGR